MGAFKKLLFAQQEYSSLDDLAELLRGEVEGRFIRCPSPGLPPSDRSCWISVSPNNPGGFYIYDCLGSRAAAAASVRSILGIIQFRPRSDSVEGARQEWNKSVSAEFTLAEVYLRDRGITLPMPAALRFQENRWHSEQYVGPAMIAAVVSPAGEITGIHQTWIAPNGCGKAALSEPRKTWGEIRQGAIRLGAVQRSLALAEGIETALSFMQASGVVAWSALSAAGLRTVVLPTEVRHVIIAADGDDKGEAAAYSAATRFRSEGRSVEIAQAPRGKDFNDLLREAHN